MSQSKKIKLGRNGPLVSPIGFGAMGMSEFYGPSTVEENHATLNHAIDIGCDLWDTADAYGNGKNEELIGEIIAKRGRDKVFLCTKFAVIRGPNGETLGLDGSPEYVKSACEASLKRLGVDYIDLYYQHRVDPNVPIEETVAAMAELVKEGKIKYLGLSEASAATIRRAHKVYPITALQVEYSPWTTDIESNGVLETCKELGIAVVAYSPLGRGFLTGQIKSPSDLDPSDWRRTNPRFQGEAFKKNLELVDALKRIAAQKSCAVGQLVLAWVMSQGIIPIPGTRKISRLDENFGAINVVITNEDDASIRKILSEIPVEGTRYDADTMKYVHN